MLCTIIFLSVSDWYATAAEVAGATMGANGTIADPVAAAASLPPPDSVSLWGLISGSGPSDDGENPVQTELLIGDVYFEGDLKLMTGNSIGNALWMSPFYPNKTTDFAAQGKLACNCSESTGCGARMAPCEKGDQWEKRRIKPCEKGHQ